MRLLRILCMALLLSVFVAAPVLAFQVEPPAPADMSWQYFVALLLNSFVIVAAVQFLKWLLPVLKLRVPWLLPILAITLGPLMAMATTAVSAALGYPVDFSPIAGVFAGGSAVAFHQFGKQLQKQYGRRLPEAA